MIYAIDASGSTSGDIMLAMINFVRGRGDGSRVIFFDTQVIKVVDARTVSYREAPRGGGTAIQPVFNWMAENAPGEDLGVVTDGYWFERKIETHGVRAACYLTSNAAQAHIETANLRAFQHIVEMR